MKIMYFLNILALFWLFFSLMLVILRIYATIQYENNFQLQKMDRLMSVEREFPIKFQLVIFVTCLCWVVSHWGFYF